MPDEDLKNTARRAVSRAHSSVPPTEDVVGGRLHEFALAVKEALRSRDRTRVNELYGRYSKESAEFAQFADAMRAGLDQLLSTMNNHNAVGR